MNVIDELINNNQPIETSNAGPIRASRLPNLEEESWKRRHSGIQGVARDILGGLGDFLLTRLKMRPMYSESQRRHKLNFAADGLNSDDPNEALAAIQRVQDIDFNAGTKLREQFIDNQRLAADQASSAEARQARIDAIKREQIIKNRGIVASYLNSLGNAKEEDRPRLYGEWRKRILSSSGSKDDTELSTLLPEQYDPISLDAFADSNIPLGTLRSQKLTKERMEIQDQNTDEAQAERERTNKVREGQREEALGISRQRAAIAERKASAPRPPKTYKPTEADIVQQLLDSGKPLTPGQQARVKKFTSGTASPKPQEGMRKRINGQVYVIKNGRPILAE